MHCNLQHVAQDMANTSEPAFKVSVLRKTMEFLFLIFKDIKEETDQLKARKKPNYTTKKMTFVTESQKVSIKKFSVHLKFHFK